MAMTFSIASAAREALLGVVFERLKQEQEEEDRKTREYEEVRPADVPSFVTWTKSGLMRSRPRRNGHGAHH